MTRAEKAERNVSICSLRAEGMSVAEIAKSYKLTKMAVYQIIRKSKAVAPAEPTETTTPVSA